MQTHRLHEIHTAQSYARHLEPTLHHLKEPSLEEEGVCC